MKTDRIMTMTELLDRHPELRPTAADTHAAMSSSALIRSLRRGACVPPRARSLGERAAHVLLWAAKEHPGKFVAHADLASILLGTTRAITTRQLVREVIAASIPGARRILQRKGHFVLGVRGTGFRCTVDKADAKANYLPRVQKYALSCARSFLSSVEGIGLVKVSAEALPTVEQSVRDMYTWLRSLHESGVEVGDERARLDVIKAALDARRRRESGD